MESQALDPMVRVAARSTFRIARDDDRSAIRKATLAIPATCDNLSVDAKRSPQRCEVAREDAAGVPNYHDRATLRGKPICRPTVRSLRLAHRSSPFGLDGEARHTSAAQELELKSLVEALGRKQGIPVDMVGRPHLAPEVDGVHLRA